MNTHHEWRLVAPTYSMPGGRPPRGTAPIFQKYDSSELVNLFLKDPRTSEHGPAKQFTVEDRVHVVRRPPQGSKLKFFNLEYAPTETRKLFLDAHKRFYLVVCELHCDVFGFPNASRDGVCEAGFVIRRHDWVFPRREIFNEFRAFKLESTANIHGLHAEALKRQGRHVVQRWVPTPGEDGVGEWRETADEPASLDETVYTLQPLIPDPREKEHPAAGRTIHFGLVPTANTNIDSLGGPQLDDESTYEVRCFVRRHKEGCPKKPTRADCKGPLVWSPPTDRYRVAAPFDLVGTSYRTINVKMPDLRALKAQAAVPKVGLRAPVRFLLPPMSGPAVGTPSLPIPGGPKLEGGICFRNIPLTTIVAMFAYNILKPIVVRIFQLYYLEPLEFCLPGVTVSVPSLLVPPLPEPPDVAIDPEMGTASDMVSPSAVKGESDAARAPLDEVGSLEELKAALAEMEAVPE